MAAPARGGGRTSRSPIRLQPVAVLKASDILADELRERILSRDYPVGTALPPERELVTQTQLSRTTVREALRVLEAQGFVRIKAGRAGGAFVQNPGSESLATSVSLLIRGRGFQRVAIYDAREAIEPSCAQLAAQHRTDADIEAMERANRAVADESNTLEGFLQANIDWHLAVAQAAHNEILTGILLGLARFIFATTQNEVFVDAAVRQSTARAHRSVMLAIRAQEPEAAHRRMSRHVHAYGEAALAHASHKQLAVPDAD